MFNTIKIWDRETEKLIKELEGHTSTINYCSFFHNGHNFVVSGNFVSLLFCFVFFEMQVQVNFSQFKLTHNSLQNGTHASTIP